MTELYCGISVTLAHGRHSVSSHWEQVAKVEILSGSQSRGSDGRKHSQGLGSRAPLGRRIPAGEEPLLWGTLVLLASAPGGSLGSSVGFDLGSAPCSASRPTM